MTAKHQTKCSLCCFSDAVSPCFSANFFRRARIAKKWSR